MSWYWWLVIGLAIFFGVPLLVLLLACIHPEFLTLLNVWQFNRWHAKMRSDPSLVEVRDAEGNHLGFEKKSAATDGSDEANDRLNQLSGPGIRNT